MANSIEKLEIKPASSIAVFLGKSFPLAEREFAEQEVPRIRGALLIKGRQIAADLEIAASLIRAKERFGKDSAFYRELIGLMKDNCEEWANPKWRERLVDAYKGYLRLEPEKNSHLHEFVITKCRSYSALAAIRKVPEKDIEWFRKHLAQQGSFPTAKAIEEFGRTNVLNTQAVTSKTPKLLAEDFSGYEDLLAKDEPQLEQTRSSDYRVDHQYPQERLSNSTAPTLREVEATPAPIIDVTPNPQQPPSPMGTLKEVATLLQRHSADDYYSIDTAEALKVLEPCLDVLDVLHEIPNRNSLKMRMVRRV